MAASIHSLHISGGHSRYVAYVACGERVVQLRCCRKPTALPKAISHPLALGLPALPARLSRRASPWRPAPLQQRHHLAQRLQCPLRPCPLGRPPLDPPPHSSLPAALLPRCQVDFKIPCWLLIFIQFWARHAQPMLRQVLLPPLWAQTGVDNSIFLDILIVQAQAEAPLALAVRQRPHLHLPLLPLWHLPCPCSSLLPHRRPCQPPHSPSRGFLQVRLI